MRCDLCPALICGQKIDDEYYSACALGYTPIEYKYTEDYTYCRKHLKTIEKELYIKEKIKQLESEETFNFNEIYEETIKEMEN